MVLRSEKNTLEEQNGYKECIDGIKVNVKEGMK